MLFTQKIKSSKSTPLCLNISISSPTFPVSFWDSDWEQQQQQKHKNKTKQKTTHTKKRISGFKVYFDWSHYLSKFDDKIVIKVL